MFSWKLSPLFYRMDRVPKVCANYFIFFSLHDPIPHSLVSIKSGSRDRILILPYLFSITVISLVFLNFTILNLFSENHGRWYHCFCSYCHNKWQSMSGGIFRLKYPLMPNILSGTVNIYKWMSVCKLDMFKQSSLGFSCKFWTFMQIRSHCLTQISLVLFVERCQC